MGDRAGAPPIIILLYTNTPMANGNGGSSMMIVVLGGGVLCCCLSTAGVIAAYFLNDDFKAWVNKTFGLGDSDEEIITQFFEKGCKHNTAKWDPVSKTTTCPGAFPIRTLIQGNQGNNNRVNGTKLQMGQGPNASHYLWQAQCVTKQECADIINKTETDDDYAKRVGLA